MEPKPKQEMLEFLLSVENGLRGWSSHQYGITAVIRSLTALRPSYISTQFHYPSVLGLPVSHYSVGWTGGAMAIQIQLDCP